MRAPARPRQPARADVAATEDAREQPAGRAPRWRPRRPFGPRTAGEVAAPHEAPASSGAAVAVHETEPGAARVSGQLRERLAERRRSIRRVRIRTLAWLAGVLVVLAGIGWLVWSSPVLTLDPADVEIRGTTLLVSEAEVRELVAPHAGEPLARLDAGALRDEIETLTGVREAVVTRDWPHGLLVEIEPRVPVANVEVNGGYALLDADGVELARSDEPTEGVPVVGVPVGAADTAASLEAVLTVMSALPEDLRAQVADASAATPYQVRFGLGSGAEVIWGSADENELKVAVLSTLLTAPASVYDISAPRSPITR